MTEAAQPSLFDAPLVVPAPTMEVCPKCAGAGLLGPFRYFWAFMRCAACEGEGKVIKR